MVWAGWKWELVIKLCYMLQKKIWIFSSVFCHTLTRDSWLLMQLLHLSKNIVSYWYFVIKLGIISHKQWKIRKTHVEMLMFEATNATASTHANSNHRIEHPTKSWDGNSCDSFSVYFKVQTVDCRWSAYPTTFLQFDSQYIVNIKETGGRFAMI